YNYDVERTTNQESQVTYFNLLINPILKRNQEIIGFILITRDITARKQMEEDLRRLSRAVEQSPSTLVITNSDGLIEYTNPQFSQITGYSPVEVYHRNPRILKSGKIPLEVYTDLWKTILSGKVWHGELCNKKKNGELFWESASISPVTNSEGQITNFIKVAEDITERKTIETTSNFLHSLLRHDVGNKIQTIHGFLSLLNETELTAEQQELVQTALNCSDDGIEVIHKVSSLKDINQIEGRQIQIIALVPVLRSVITSYIGRTTKSEIKIDFTPTSDNYHVLGGIFLQELFSNIIENSIKHSKGTLLRITIQEIDDQIRILFDDNGIGIPNSDKDKITQKGFKGAGSKGSGLGMHLVQTIVESYNGTLTISDSDLGGAQFIISLQKS
ncbi:MAG: PAS domain S-box protein, partial [Candidatus Hodarchaeota archaeon]